MMRSLFIFIQFIGFSLFSAAQDITGKELERNIEAGKIYKEADAEKKEKVYLNWLKKYPPRNFPSSKMLYEYIKAELSKSFVKEGKIEKAIHYSDQLISTNWRPEGWSEIAAVMSEENYLDQAVSLYKKAIANTNTLLKNEKDSLKIKSLSVQLADYNYAVG